jgi:hypothetical protein
MELQGVTATINRSPINVFNLYLPPASSCPPHYKPNLNPLFGHSDSDAIIMGDLNTLHGAWFVSSTCPRGEAIIDDVESSSFCVINTDTPTRLPSQGNSNSPDVTLISAHLALSAVWGTHVKCNSDHLPILIDVGGYSPPVRSAKTYMNSALQTGHALSGKLKTASPACRILSPVQRVN